MSAPKVRKVAPDGGWAWMVCLGVSLVNFSTRSLEPSFGLLFGDLLQSLGVETTGASVITSTLDSVVNFSGFFVGPVIKTFSYRKVCFVGSVITALGLLLTAPADSMAHILITYSIFGGIGVGLASSSSFVSLNHYFTKKRGQAVGLSMAGTGFGLMVMPQLVRLLLDEYGFRGAVIVLGALAFHSVLGSTLLQPVKWHLIDEPIDQEMQVVKEMDRIDENDEENEDKFEMNPLMNNKLILASNHASKGNMNHPSIRNMSLPRAATCDKPLPEYEKLKQNSLTTAASVAAMQRVMSSSSMSEAARKRKVSVISNISNMDFTGSYLQLYLDTADDDDQAIQMKSSKKTGNGTQAPSVANDGFFKRFVGLMDLDLLRDPSYLNLLLGLSLFWSGELQFRMLTPFFISNMGYTKTETAFCLSVTAISDILVRLILPPIFDKRNVSKKLIFFVAAFFTAITRTVLALQTEWVPLMIWLSICGFFRGVCLSNFTLTISEFCPLEKLPAAFGLHMVAKGIFVVIIGPIIGLIRDKTGSYPLCIIVQNILIMSCVVCWAIEYAIKFCRRRKIVQL